MNREKIEKESKKNEATLEPNHEEVNLHQNNIEIDETAAIIKWNAIKVDVRLAEDETAFEDIDDEAPSSSTNQSAPKTLQGM